MLQDGHNSVHSKTFTMLTDMSAQDCLLCLAWTRVLGRGLQVQDEIITRRALRFAVRATCCSSFASTFGESRSQLKPDGKAKACWGKQKPVGEGRTLLGKAEACWGKQKPVGEGRSLLGKTEACWGRQKPFVSRGVTGGNPPEPGVHSAGPHFL